MASPLGAADCAICMEPLPYPNIVCPGTAHEELQAWLESEQTPQPPLPDATHKWHVTCMYRWRRRLQAENRRGNCPVCRKIIADCSYTIYAGGIIEHVASSGSEALSASMSRSSSETWSSSSGFGTPRGTGEDLERVWLQLARLQDRLHEVESSWLQVTQMHGRHRFCATGTRALVPASELASALNIQGVTEEVLVRE